MSVLHTPGPWRQGFTLLTDATRRWTPEQWQQNNARERRLVFANFTSLDQGSSRKLVAVCESEADARLISAAPKLLFNLKRLCAIADGGDVVCWANEWDNARAVISKIETPLNYL